jgi:peptidoglycan/LPS O-acetylase OafA/YrhL
MLFVPLELAGDYRFDLKLWLVAGLAIGGFATYQLYPNQISLFAGYFIIWWTGAEIARDYIAHSDIASPRLKLALAVLVICALLWATPVLLALRAGADLRYGVDPVLQARHFASATAIVAIGFLWRAQNMRGFDYIFGPFRLLAPISYSLYLLHVPVFQTLENLGVSDPVKRTLYAAIVLAPLCYLFEVRIQRVINGWTDRFFDTSPTLASVAA